MPTARKIYVALVGLRFGAEFIPIYLHHSNVASLTLCDTDAATLAQWGDKYQVERRARSLDEVLANRQLGGNRSSRRIPCSFPCSRCRQGAAAR